MGRMEIRVTLIPAHDPSHDDLMEDCSFEPYRFTQPKQAFSTYELLYTKQLGVRIYAKLDFERELEEPVVKEGVEEVIGEKEA